MPEPQVKCHSCAKFPQGEATGLHRFPVSFVTNKQRRLVSFLVSSPDKTHATGGLGGPPPSAEDILVQRRAVRWNSVEKWLLFYLCLLRFRPIIDSYAIYGRTIKFLSSDTKSLKPMGGCGHRRERADYLHAQASLTPSPVDSRWWKQQHRLCRGLNSGHPDRNKFTG